MTSKQRETILFLIVVITGLTYTFFSEGFYFIDEVGHYLYNRNYFYDPIIALDAWGRFGRVILFAIPAIGGRTIVKLTGFLIFLLTIYLTKKTADHFNIKNSEYLWILTGLQPVYFDISYTCLPEIPTIFLIVISLYSYLKKRDITAIICSSLIIWFRNEALIFTALLFIVYVIEKKWKLLLLFFTGPFILWLYSIIFTADPLFILNEFKRYSAIPKYREGTELYYYLLHTPDIFGIIVLSFFIIGFTKLTLYKQNYFIFLLTGTIAGFFILVTITSSKYFNISGSIGDLRYLAQIAPLIALIALNGLNLIFDKLKRTQNIFGNLIVIFALLFLITATEPHKYSEYEKIIISLIETARENDKDKIIYCNHWIADAYMELPYKNFGMIQRYDAEKIKKINSGFIIWDSLFTESLLSDAHLKAGVLLNDSTLKLIKADSLFNMNFYLFFKEPRDKTEDKKELIRYYKPKKVLGK